MNTSQHQNSLSRIFPNKGIAITVESLLLFSAGILAGFLHYKLKIPMHLPGKQGILFLLIIITSAYASRMSMAATIATTGTAAFFYLFAFDSTDILKPLLFLFVAVAIDTVIHFHRIRSFGNIPFIILAGAAWTIIPIIRIIITLFTGFPYQSFISGFAYPFVTHLLFGMTAAAISLFTLKLLKK